MAGQEDLFSDFAGLLGNKTSQQVEQPEVEESVSSGVGLAMPKLVGSPSPDQRSFISKPSLKQEGMH